MDSTHGASTVSHLEHKFLLFKHEGSSGKDRNEKNRPLERDKRFQKGKPVLWEYRGELLNAN